MGIFLFIRDFRRLGLSPLNKTIKKIEGINIAYIP